MSWTQISSVVDEATKLAEAAADAEGAKAALAAAGLAEGAPYGMSKALMNCYAMSVANRYPQIKV